MDDLIKREDAIVICINAIDLWNGQIGCGALIAVKDKIADLPSAHQWIPVSERLPEDGTEVLASTENYVYMAELKTYDGKHLWEESEGRWILADVTAWMPLPEPYKATAPERDCGHCVHRKDMGCEKWDCEFERRTE